MCLLGGEVLTTSVGLAGTVSICITVFIKFDFFIHSNIISKDCKINLKDLDASCKVDLDL